MPRSSARAGLLALAGLLLAGASACGHPLQNGVYDFTADGAPVSDTCAMAPDGGSFWSGTLTTTGEEVILHYALGGPPNDVQLQGFFKSPEYGANDGFLVDGTQYDIPAPVEGIDGGCTADSLTVHVDATVVDSTHLSGLLQVKYAFTAPTDGPCMNVHSCDLEAHFKAALRK